MGFGYTSEVLWKIKVKYDAVTTKNVIMLWMIAVTSIDASIHCISFHNINLCKEEPD